MQQDNCSESRQQKDFLCIFGRNEGVNETKLGIPGDVYAPSVLAANEGDTILYTFIILIPVTGIRSRWQHHTT